jgi:hypothetical protein
MARSNISLAFLVTFAVFWVAGCSTEAWYEGMKFSAQDECRRLPPGDRDSCLTRVNTMTYGEYENTRRGKDE